jgi:Ca2+-binding EF-hand superfamily protein/thiol-disulfide isomerase/thioredoxin
MDFSLNSFFFLRQLLAKYPDKIIIVKFFAPWCRACKGLEPKFIQISKDKKYENLPLVFAQLSVAAAKDYVKALGVLALPSIHMYAGSEGLVENFPCGPSKVPLLKQKIAAIVNQKVDPNTYELKPVCDALDESTPCTDRSIVTGTTGDETKLSVGDVVVSKETMDYLRNDVPFFKDFSDEEFSTLMSKATYSTFEPGAIIMKQGMPGYNFYVIDSGSVEIMVKAAFEDPLTTPSGYLGAVVNRLSKHQYFGERSLITGQPRAASIRALEKTRCFTFDIKDIPESSVLSGKLSPSQERIAQVNDKYAVDFYDINLIKSQFEGANKANQARGSLNKPGTILGVDTDDEINEDDIIGDQFVATGPTPKDEVLSLLIRFKLLRQAARCFEYIKTTNPAWGDQGEINRRNLLVSKLTPSQRTEFINVFKLIDTSNDGLITLPEMKAVLSAVDDEKSESELLDMINKADPSVDGNTAITLSDFIGVMAEAEFYYLFKETFASLDRDNSGYVQAGKIDQILCGLRDLISDDRSSLIDIDDKDILIDYETFARMMIGTA